MVLTLVAGGSHLYPTSSRDRLCWVSLTLVCCCHEGVCPIATTATGVHAVVHLLLSVRVSLGPLSHHFLMGLVNVVLRCNCIESGKLVMKIMSICSVKSIILYSW